MQHGKFWLHPRGILEIKALFRIRRKTISIIDLHYHSSIDCEHLQMERKSKYLAKNSCAEKKTRDDRSNVALDSALIRDIKYQTPSHPTSKFKAITHGFSFLQQAIPTFKTCNKEKHANIRLYLSSDVTGSRIDGQEFHKSSYFFWLTVPPCICNRHDHYQPEISWHIISIPRILVFISILLFLLVWKTLNEEFIIFIGLLKALISTMNCCI